MCPSGNIHSVNKHQVKMKFLITLLTVVIINLASSIDVRVDPLVLIDQGLIRGQKASDGDYSKFLGVPYARVDTENPFGASLAIEPSESVFYAYDGSIVCPQSDLDGSNFEETLDCLRLNIFVPNEANSANPLPVLLWIHGGGFDSGKGPENNAENLVKHGVVLVTINYRLGAYGFMCLDDPSVPGNQGLKDQFAALSWVKNNIAAFGGNPNKITIGGQSAGASSVRYHLYSSQEKIFDKAIIESYPTDDVNGDNNAALKLCQHLGFNATSTSSALKFLANTSSILVIAATRELGLNFKPCKELPFDGVENIIVSHPDDQQNINKIRSTPILIGINSLERQGQDFDSSSIAQTLSIDFNFDSGELNRVSNLVKHFYLGDENEVDNPAIGDEFQSDLRNSHVTHREITKLLSQNAGPVYSYVFSFVNDGSLGALHSAELEYLFANKETFDDEEKVLAERLGKMWANFIKHGTPIPETDDLLTISWEAVISDSRPYLDIGADLTLNHHFRHQSMAFWDLFYECYSAKKL